MDGLWFVPLFTQARRLIMISERFKSIANKMYEECDRSLFYRKALG